jgi:hypothetical protein
MNVRGKKKLNEKKKKIGEKVEEGEMKGHGCWPSPYPPISPYFLLHSHSQWVFWPRRGG